MQANSHAFKLLTPEDFIEIKKEHAELESFISELLNACACSHTSGLNNFVGCDHEKLTSCQGRLPSFLFYVLYLAGKHFDHEETIILNTLHVTKQHELFRLHHQAHEDILQKLHLYMNEWISTACCKNTPIIYNQFYKVLDDLFKEHDHKFDAPFIQFTSN